MGRICGTNLWDDSAERVQGADLRTNHGELDLEASGRAAHTCKSASGLNTIMSSITSFHKQEYMRKFNTTFAFFRKSRERGVALVPFRSDETMGILDAF